MIGDLSISVKNLGYIPGSPDDSPRVLLQGGRLRRLGFQYGDAVRVAAAGDMLLVVRERNPR